jgi:hypothetical protein
MSQQTRNMVAEMEGKDKKLLFRSGRIGKG